MMLSQMRLVPLGSAATGPLITRFSDGVAPRAVILMLGSPGESGSPSGSSPSPGTRVESATWMTEGAPPTSNWPAIQTPLIKSCPPGAGWPDAPGGPATPVTATSPVIVTRDLSQMTSRGPPEGTGAAATMARLLPAGSSTEGAVRSTVSDAKPGTTMMPDEPGASSFQPATALSSVGYSAEPTTAKKVPPAGFSCASETERS